MLLTKVILVLLLIITPYYGGRVHYGEVVIVMSRGRSGSGFLCRLVENVANAQRYVLSNELFGGTHSKMLLIDNPKSYMKHYLQHLRKSYPKNIIGFKWKPYADNEAYDEALRWTARHNFTVIYSHRNPLDEYISRQKHKQSTIAAHCKTGNKQCLEQTMHVKVTLDIDATIQFVKEQVADQLKQREKLQKLGVKFIEINYEDLAFGDKTTRLAHLQRVADFFVPAHRQRKVTWKDFDVGIEATSSNNQSSKVEHYPKVVKAITDAGFADLLHA